MTSCMRKTSNKPHPVQMVAEAKNGGDVEEVHPSSCNVDSPTSPIQSFCLGQLESDPADLESQGPLLDSEVQAIQEKLDMLTQAKAKKDAEKDPQSGLNDPTDLLLAHGLRALLHKMASMAGPNAAPSILVTFSDLTFRATTYAGTNVIATVGSRVLQVLTFWKRRATVDRYVLKDVTGSFRPGRTTLILGPPRSGKSSLMKAIAGRLEESKKCQLEGVVEYSGRRLRESKPGKGQLQLVKLVSYVPQVDEHIPTLTVRETIRFASRCTAELRPSDLAGENLSDEARAGITFVDQLAPEIVMATLGIRHVGDTIVGNESLRGVSGGQRKRLTTAEMVVARTPVLLADEISTGLDSATTFDICTAFKTVARTMHTTIAVSLLQPTPETFETFDDVLVMAEGQVVYLGARTEVLPYFAGLGFGCPKDTDTAEFLQEVTLPKGTEKYRMPAPAVPRGGSQPTNIHTAADFGLAWRNSALFHQRQAEDQKMYAECKAELDALPPEGHFHRKATSEYSVTAWESMRLCLDRQVRLTLRNTAMTTGRFAQMIFIALIMGSLFFRLNVTAYSSKLSVIFFSMMNIALGGFSLIPSIVEEMRVIHRQRDARFFHAWPYTVALNLLDIPLSVVEAVLFCVVAYWMAGLSPTASDFLLFMLAILLLKLAMGALFRFVAVIAPSQAMAQSLGVIIILVFILHAGYFMAYPDMKKWWIWAYWANPLQHTFTSLALIEFRSSQYSGLRDPAHPSKGTWGDYYLDIKKLPMDQSRLYMGFIFNACWFVGFAVLNSLALTFVRWPNPFPPEPPTPPEEAEAPKAAEVPFTPCTLAWDHVCYDVDDPGQKGSAGKLALRLLNEVSGFAKPSTMTALMGSSGAGKTTLLDVLAGRKNTGRVTGGILLNGQLTDPIAFSRCSGYVEQVDIHSPSATVAEALRFSALLRLPHGVPAADKEAHAWQVLRQLNLHVIANCLIGSGPSGLSVEQIKRVTIGVEMAANPAVLFLDEPTSGLDSMAADAVIDALKVVTASGRTLICTIHQPSTRLFSSFQCLLLLARGGKTVFFGTTGQHSEALIRYFEAVPGTPKHNGTQNPATWMLTVIATEGIDFPATYAASALSRANDQELQKATARVGDVEVASTQTADYQTTRGEQFRILLQKWMLLHWRTPSYNLSRTFTCLIVALIIGSIFWRIDGNDQQTVFTRVGLQYMALMFISMLFANTMQSIVATERKVFYRERAAHMYHPALFSVVVGVCELPYVTFNCFVFTATFYWMVGLAADAGLFFFWFFIFWLFILFYTYFGFLIGCLMPSATSATAVVAVYTTVGGLVAGFMIPRLSIPWWWRWLHFAVPQSYAIQCLVSSQLFCEAAELDPNNPGNCPTFPVANPDGTTQIVAAWVFVRNQFNLSYYDRWMYVGIIVACVTAVRLASALVVLYVNHAKR